MPTPHPLVGIGCHHARHDDLNRKRSGYRLSEERVVVQTGSPLPCWYSDPSGHDIYPPATFT